MHCEAVVTKDRAFVGFLIRRGVADEYDMMHAATKLE